VAGGEGLIAAYAGGRHFPGGAYAVLMACLPVGMLVGDLVVGRVLLPGTRERLSGPLVVLLGVPLLGFAGAPGPAAAGGLLLASGCGFGYQVGLQRRFLDAVPEAARGHAFGLLSAGLMTAQGAAPAAFGALAPVLGTGRAMATAGVAVLACLPLLRRS